PSSIVTSRRACTWLTIALGKGRLTLACGDGIQTEESHKYTAERIEALASSCGLAVRDQWRDDNTQFAVVLLSGG
ncbi:MAG: L-histidine N(alpha)-methyltransferase, partial [Planctomycetota bacterium]